MRQVISKACLDCVEKFDCGLYNRFILKALGLPENFSGHIDGNIWDCVHIDWPIEKSGCYDWKGLEPLKCSDE